MLILLGCWPLMVVVLPILALWDMLFGTQAARWFMDGPKRDSRVPDWIVEWAFRGFCYLSAAAQIWLAFMYLS